MLYTSSIEYPYIFIFETKDAATQFRLPACDSVPRMPEALLVWSEVLKANISLSKPQDLIFVISKEIFAFKNKGVGYAVFGKEVDLWNVIIGEKAGWILVPHWLNLKQLNE
jgi:hypothetical protein